jgi:hypothetical protein
MSPEATTESDILKERRVDRLLAVRKKCGKQEEL